eukprot:scaffold61199_cov66-Phaeocystis_antarctica.AAC.2
MLLGGVMLLGGNPKIVLGRTRNFPLRGPERALRARALLLGMQRCVICSLCQALSLGWPRGPAGVACFPPSAQV